MEEDVYKRQAIEIKNPEALSDADIVTAGAYTILMEMKNKSEE